LQALGLVELAQAAKLYIFYDNREEFPTCLSNQFKDTGIDIGLDECSSPQGVPMAAARGPGLSIDHRFSVWQRDMAREESIQLGALGRGKNAKAMHGVAAVPRPAPNHRRWALGAKAGGEVISSDSY
jgi:hypothetical protein